MKQTMYELLYKAFDEMAIILTSVTFNIHTMIMSEKSVWKTSVGKEFSGCDIRLEYTGDVSFKEVVALMNSSAKKPNINLDYEPEGNNDNYAEDLLNTGLVKWRKLKVNKLDRNRSLPHL